MQAKESQDLLRTASSIVELAIAFFIKQLANLGEALLHFPGMNNLDACLNQQSL